MPFSICKSFWRLFSVITCHSFSLLCARGNFFKFLNQKLYLFNSSTRRPFVRGLPVGYLSTLFLNQWIGYYFILLCLLCMERQYWYIECLLFSVNSSFLCVFFLKINSKLHNVICCDVCVYGCPKGTSILQDIAKRYSKTTRSLGIAKIHEKNSFFFRALKKLNKFSRTVKINDILLKMKQES